MSQWETIPLPSPSSPATMTEYRQRRPGSSTLAAGTRCRQREVSHGPARGQLGWLNGLPPPPKVREVSGISTTLQKTHNFLSSLAECFIFQNAATGTGFLTILSSIFTDANQGSSPVHCAPAENFPLLSLFSMWLGEQVLILQHVLSSANKQQAREARRRG